MPFNLVTPIRTRMATSGCDLALSRNTSGVQLLLGPKAQAALDLDLSNLQGVGLTLRVGDGAEFGLVELRIAAAEPGWAMTQVVFKHKPPGVRVRIRPWDGCPLKLATTPLFIEPSEPGVIRFRLPWVRTPEEVRPLGDVDYRAAKRFLRERGISVEPADDGTDSDVEGERLSREAVIAMAASLRDLTGQAA